VKALLRSWTVMMVSYVLASASLWAQTPNESAASSSEQAQKKLWADASAAMVRGPQMVKLLDQAELALPEGYGFVPREQAARLMESMGNATDSRFIGLIFPLGSADLKWFVTVDYEDAGYIKDDDAKKWDADELLDNLKKGAEAGNERRIKQGAPPLKVTRWVEAPTYNTAQHRLVWSAEARLRDGDDLDPGVNYNTYVLGREGYISMNLVTSLSTVEGDKPAANQLLAAIHFNQGKRYGDFNSSTDKVAEYGLAALVGGLAVKKLGLLAVMGAFFAKFAKVILIALAAGGAGLRKFFKRKPDTETSS
jgi:uncharacterized membrane-anchored protein